MRIPRGTVNKMVEYKITLALKDNPDQIWDEVVEREYVGAYLVGALRQGFAFVVSVEKVIEQ
tara:strand:+ start:334 stop:519 length:186 start_codon:yes stop_codon:yes gene_type:complete